MTAHAPLDGTVDPIVALARTWALEQGTTPPAGAELEAIFSGATSTDGHPGLAFADWLGPTSVGGVVGPLLSNAPTPRWLLQRLAHYHPLIGADSVTFAAAPSGGVLTILGANDTPARPHTVDACFGIVQRMLAQLAGMRLPVRLELSRPRPDDVERYLQRFGPVRFGAPRDALTVPSEVLDLPLSAGDPHVRTVLVGYANTLLAQRTLPWSRLVAEHVDLQQPSLPSVARRLALSSRTLQNYLRDEGATFSGIVDDLRRRRALDLLRSSTASTAVIAEAVGLQSASALTRAVKRWTGRTPTEIRTGDL